MGWPAWDDLEDEDDNMGAVRPDDEDTRITVTCQPIGGEKEAAVTVAAVGTGACTVEFLVPTEEAVPVSCADAAVVLPRS